MGGREVGWREGRDISSRGLNIGLLSINYLHLHCRER